MKYYNKGVRSGRHKHKLDPQKVYERWVKEVLASIGKHCATEKAEWCDVVKRTIEKRGRKND